MQTQAWDITFSIGVLTVLCMPRSVATLVSLTDALMYKVKTHGKNAIHYSVLESETDSPEIRIISTE